MLGITDQIYGHRKEAISVLDILKRRVIEISFDSLAVPKRVSRSPNFVLRCHLSVRRNGQAKRKHTVEFSLTVNSAIVVY